MSPISLMGYTSGGVTGEGSATNGATPSSSYYDYFQVNFITLMIFLFFSHVKLLWQNFDHQNDHDHDYDHDHKHDHDHDQDHGHAHDHNLDRDRDHDHDHDYDHDHKYP